MKMAEQEFPFNESLGSMNIGDKLINRSGEGENFICVYWGECPYGSVCVKYGVST